MDGAGLGRAADRGVRIRKASIGPLSAGPASRVRAGGKSAYGGDPERRSVRSSDRDLLSGADAEASDTNLVGAVEVQGGSGGKGAATVAGAGTGKVVGVEFDG